MKIKKVKIVHGEGMFSFVEIEFKRYDKLLVDTIGMIQPTNTKFLATSKFNTEKECKTFKKAVKFLVNEFENKMFN